MKELEGRTGIVTGGSSGIGYAIANTLAQAGAKVYAISRSGAVKSGMAPSAEGVIHVRGDVTDGARMAEIIREIGEKEGLDFLVNDAGITQKHRAEVFPMETFEQILSVNVTSVFRLCQLCYPYLSKSAHKGRIVNISSMAAHLGFSEVVPYCTSKAAVCGMTRGLPVEWANDNMCVNSIAPGWFPSEMNRQVMTPERKALFWRACRCMPLAIRKTWARWRSFCSATARRISPGRISRWTAARWRMGSNSF